MVKITDIYKKPRTMKYLLERPDVLGKDCIWYFNEYQIFRILETKIMNQYILERWQGPVVINSDLMDYSVPYNIFFNKHSNIADIQIYENIMK